jgi:lysophospholipase
MSWDDPPLVLSRRAAAAPRIAYRVFRPKDAAKVAVLMSYGYFENMARYREVIERWNALGILAAIYDYRGHGLSEGARGRIMSWDDYVGDTLELLDTLGKDDAFRRLGPPVMFGHSMGGLVTIHVALRAQERISGVALSSPWLGLALPVPAVKILAGRVLSRLLPTVSLDAGLKGSDTTRNRELAEAYDKDPMNFKKANARWFTEAVRAQERAFEDAPKLNVPIFCLQAGDDKVALPAATERFMERVSSVDRQYLRLPGLYHEILNEPERATWIDKFATAMLSWRSAPAEAKVEPRL